MYIISALYQMINLTVRPPNINWDETFKAPEIRYCPQNWGRKLLIYTFLFFKIGLHNIYRIYITCVILI